MKRTLLITIFSGIFMVSMAKDVFNVGIQNLSGHDFKITGSSYSTTDISSHSSSNCQSRSYPYTLDSYGSGSENICQVTIEGVGDGDYGDQIFTGTYNGQSFTMTINYHNPSVGESYVNSVICVVNGEDNGKCTVIFNKTGNETSEGYDIYNSLIIMTD